MKNRKSISFVFLRYQVFFVSLIAVTLIAGGIMLYQYQRNDLLREYTYLTQRGAEKTAALMERQQKNLTDIFWSIVNHYDGLWSERDDRRYFDEQKVKTLFTDKKIIDSSLQVLFCMQPGSFMVFHGGEDLGFKDRLAIQDYIREDYADIASVRSVVRWKIREIGGKDYCILCYSYRDKNLHIGLVAETAQILSGVRDVFAGKAGSISFGDSSGNEYLEMIGDYDGKRAIRIDPVPVQDDLVLSASIRADYLRFETGIFLSLFLVLIAASLIWYLLMLRTIRKAIVQPVIRLSSEVQEIQTFDGSEHVSEDADTEELRILQSKFNQFLQEVVWEKMSQVSLQMEKQEQELLMLRTQLRPHFFLNAIMTVDAMTYQNRNRDIREYLNALSNYIRYLILPEQMVPLREELANLETYFDMMDIRYPGKAVGMIDCRKELSEIRIPHLMLLTVVENCYKYAMNLEELLQIMILCRHVEEADFSGVEIVIEDNGPGFSEERIKTVLNEEGGSPIGLRNVRSTLRIQYGREDLFCIRNASPRGAVVEIRIPDQGEKHETADC